MNSSMITLCFGGRGEKCQIPKALPSNDSVAGPATLFPFVIISSLCITATFVSIIYRQFRLKSESPQAFMQNGTIWSIIVFSLSTAQLTSSIASSLAALHLRDSISAYHYNIVCYLGIAAVFTSSASMLVPFAHTYKSWSSIIRLTLLLMLIILLGILLSPRFTHYKVFPGRAPLDHASNDTALVFQVSCLLEMRDALNTFDCAFPNDRKPIWVVSDVLVMIPLCLVLIFTGAICSIWGDVESGSNHNFRASLILLGTEMILVLVSAAWAGVALWQCFDLRNWMNESGLLSDNKETSISSFGAIVPFFMMIGTFLLLFGAATDDWSQRREKQRSVTSPSSERNESG